MRIDTYFPLLCAENTAAKNRDWGGSSPFFLLRWKDSDIERLKRGGCYEREKQRGKGKQEGTAKKPQREEKDEEGEEKQVSWRVSTIQ